MKNREIKFRIWDANWDGKTMVYLTTLEFDNGLWFQAPNQHHIDETIAIMQYTGLLDKTGKEIYEGDIVEWTSKFLDTDITILKRGQVKYNQEGCRYHINWLLNGKNHYKELLATRGGDGYAADYIEVVGNIYQTPEKIESDGNACSKND